MRHRAQEAVGVRWEVDTSRLRLEVENGTNEGGVLVRETVVLLSRPGRGLEVVERTARMTPGSLAGLINKGRKLLQQYFTQGEYLPS